MVTTIILGAAAGGALGYGCPTGGCPLTGNPWISTPYGMIVGATLASSFR